MADRAGVLSYVGIDRDELTHALLTVDAELARTVCGRKVTRSLDEVPAPVDRCPDCWADWRVRGDALRWRRTFR